MYRIETRKDKIKIIRAVLEGIVLILAVVAIVKALTTDTVYTAYDPEDTTVVSGKDAGFIAVSYFGVDRQGTDTLISTIQLDEQLKTLHDLGYVTISQEDVINYYEKGTALPDKALFLLFEDGRRDTALFARKILEKYNYKATILSYADKFEEKDPKFLSTKDLKELVDYAAARNVGIILWAGYYAFERDMENVCRYFSEMGVKGFKVDFMDRDDQLMTDFNHRAAAMCAKYHLILDLHGTHKPAGLNRTYPNVLNFEGVHGLEQMKWRPAGFDQITYDVMIPFIRQVAGPMDYTQGAMRNATRENYYPSNSEPMSQGTRCHQLAMYIVLESPFNMLCDSPSNYMREPESTSFIAQVPTVWDETVVLDGKMGEYIITARRKGDTWFVGGLNNWDARDVEVDLSFLSSGSHKAVLFKDGVNAHRTARDYKREEVSVSSAQPLKVHLAPGGGFTLQID